jgi:hypothetical protein
MSKHTPGPWFRDQYGNMLAKSGDRVVFRSVTTVCSGSDERIAEAEANTTLATSAPELLEALEATTMLLRVKRHACANTEVCHVLDTHIKRNQAVLAKARGEA